MATNASHEICSPHCIYFPQVPQEVYSEKTEDGVTHRSVQRRCRYDGHRIISWEECDFYTKGYLTAEGENAIMEVQQRKGEKE